MYDQSLNLEHHNTYSKLIYLLMIASSFIWITDSLAADQQDYIKESRLRQIFYVGTGMYQGTVAFQSDRLQLQSDLSFLPMLQVGAQWWGDESKGLYTHAELGLGADLTLPAAYQSQVLNFNQNSFLLGGHYRWHLSARPLAPDITLRLGLYAMTQDVGQQNPTLFVNRSTYGPQLSTAFTYPWKAHIWTRLQFGLSNPVLMREEPADSGEMDQGYQWFVQLEQHVKISRVLGIYVIVNYSQEDIDFVGFGTRANGVQQGTHQQDMVSASIAVSYR